MDVFLRTYFSIPIVIRAVVAAGAGYILLEMFKPSFAFSETEDGYVAKPFSLFTSEGSGGRYDDDDRGLIPSTNIPWWTIPAGLFGFFYFIV